VKNCSCKWFLVEENYVKRRFIIYNSQKSGEQIKDDDVRRYRAGGK
jgi:hypothetical protein